MMMTTSWTAASTEYHGMKSANNARKNAVINPTTERVINPDVLLKAAEMAYPDCEWKLEQNSPTGNAVYRYGSPHLYFFYSDRNDMKDAWALMLVLKKQGWRFGGYELPYADLIKPMTMDLVCRLNDPSDTILLLKCVAAMNSIELYVSGGGCAD